MSQFDPNFHLKPPSCHQDGLALKLHMRNKLLLETLADLEWLEGTSKTSFKRRSLIAEIKYVTK